MHDSTHMQQLRVEDEHNEITEGILLLPDDITPTNSLVVFIHGFNVLGAQELIVPAQRLLKQGYAVLLPSQKGFGSSTGTRDYCGPRTQDGILSLLRKVRQNNSDNFESIFLWGVSRGATVAGMLAAQADFTLDGLIMQSGCYDLKVRIDSSTDNDEFVQSILSEINKESGVLRARSPLMYAEDIHVPTLIIHGELDTQIPSAQATVMANALAEHNNAVELIILPNEKHKVSGPRNTKDRVLPFLDMYRK